VPRKEPFGRVIHQLRDSLMIKSYASYRWKMGRPYGVNGEIEDGVSYQILADPYRKRMSIERYERETFSSVIYDSALFNFRHLKAEMQIAWRKDVIKETAQEMTCLIRDQDDRIILREVYTFEKAFCKECRAFSPHGIPISLQKMFYKKLGDPFNGVILFDINDIPVLKKIYETNPSTGEFTTLLEEFWEVKEELALS